MIEMTFVSQFCEIAESKRINCKMEKRKLRIAVIGCGPAGLCCTKHAIDYGHDVTVYEQNSKVGGTWIYTDKIGSNEFGIPIHSSMYKGLHTNIPVEVMGFLGHPFPRKNRSFVCHEDVLAYFQSYADEFNLNRVIKFQNQVINVRPLQRDRWEVFSKDLQNNICETEQFDRIFICNGHYTAKYIPRFDGLDMFTGHKMHSKDYRRPDQYQDETVLVLGAGPSGKDITYEIATKAKQVILSHHRDIKIDAFPSNVKLTGDVKRFKANSVEFVNGDEQTISCILFCTGYTYSFPFLSVDGGICLKDNYLVQPLYKHLININHPTMAIVGLQICAYTFMYDLQARLCLKYWSGELELPTKDQMLQDFETESVRRKEIGKSFRQSHLLNMDQAKYLRELSDIGQMIKMPEVLHKIYEDCNSLRIEYPSTYREFNYTILDDETFERTRISQ